MSKTVRKATSNETTPLELAEATLRTFEQKRARLATKREDDDKELAQISYQAHTGDKDAADGMRLRYQAYDALTSSYAGTQPKASAANKDPKAISTRLAGVAWGLISLMISLVLFYLAFY
jgi:hypothetical protein